MAVVKPLLHRAHIGECAGSLQASLQEGSPPSLWWRS